MVDLRNSGLIKLHAELFVNYDLSRAEDAVFCAVASAKDFSCGVGCTALLFLNGLVECRIKLLAFFSEDFDTVRL